MAVTLGVMVDTGLDTLAGEIAIAQIRLKSEKQTENVGLVLHYVGS